MAMGIGARSLWAKSGYNECEGWLPLYVHMSDTSLVASYLWDEWLPVGIRSYFAHRMGVQPGQARQIVVFFAAIHDLGKATPYFQLSLRRLAGRNECPDLSWKVEKAGLPLRSSLLGACGLPHAAASQILLEHYLQNTLTWKDRVVRTCASVVGAHHGRPAYDDQVNGPMKYKSLLGWHDDEEYAIWNAVQQELVEYALTLCDMEVIEQRFFENLSAPVASLLSGLVIMSDWIASNQEYFPLISVMTQLDTLGDDWLNRRKVPLKDVLQLVSPWHPAIICAQKLPIDFTYRFGWPQGATMRPVQRAALNIACSSKDIGIMIIEAPMGEGKTEAAQAAAEALCAQSGRGGVVFALPTMATTDAMFGRIHTWLNHLPGTIEDKQTFFLAHGKAGLNDEYQGLIASSRRQGNYAGLMQDEEGDGSCVERAVASEWLKGRKKGMLANFVVCTIDQVLMTALQMKHLALRHVAIANKVVVIDECHAYDRYMQEYLMVTLEWLGAWGTPVILLSATLPLHLRQAYIDAYQRGKQAQPQGLKSMGIQKNNPFGMLRAKLNSSSASDGSNKHSQEQVLGKCFAVDSNGSFSKEEGVHYPLITYTDGIVDKFRAIEPSGRAVTIHLEVVDDSEEQLVELLRNTLIHGGCAAVICTTVGRAQQAYRALREEYDCQTVLLTHARFTDIDRIANEQKIRSLLGPHASRADGSRPHRLIVIGTQVLEQSLDIDFDVMVSDIAPVDLLLQRLGRLHRHATHMPFRPQKLCKPQCFIRGITDTAQGVPQFVKSIERVYERASLMETLAVLPKLLANTDCSVELPRDIAPLVQQAYGPDVGSIIRTEWQEFYQDACAKREIVWNNKCQRAQACLLPSAAKVVKEMRSLTGLYGDRVTKAQRLDREEAGPRAVRDTQETVEVMLAWKDGDVLRLLPWIGSKINGVLPGSEIPTLFEPSPEMSKLLAQVAVRLPLSMCQYDQLDALINKLEEIAMPYVAAWQESSWLAGMLLLPLEKDQDGNLSTELNGWTIRYSNEEGLTTVCG